MIIKAFVVVVIGGMGSIVGAVVCGLLIGLLQIDAGPGDQRSTLPPL